MKRMTALLLPPVAVALAFCGALLAEERKKIHVDRMEGMEPIVEKALQDAELPFDFVEEIQHPDLKANLRKMHSAYGEILYKHKLGRNETHRLELRDVERNKVIAWHAFQLIPNDPESSRKAAAEFATKVRAALGNKQRSR
jgi:hypothetical protein